MYTLTEDGLEALGTLTKTEHRVLRGLFANVADKECVAMATQTSISIELGISKAAVNYAYTKLKMHNIITPICFGKTAINPRLFYKGKPHEIHVLYDAYRDYRQKWKEMMDRRAEVGDRGFVEYEQ